MKKGVSGVIAVVLLLLITVSAAVLLATYLYSNVKQVNSVEDNTDISIVSSEGFTAFDSTNGLVSVQVRRGPEESTLTAIHFLFLFSDGSTYDFQRSDIPDINQVMLYKFNLSGYPLPKKVSIAPILLGREAPIASSFDFQRYDSKVSEDGIISSPSDKSFNNSVGDGPFCNQSEFSYCEDKIGNQKLCNIHDFNLCNSVYGNCTNSSLNFGSNCNKLSDDFYLTEKALVVYNKNSASAREIAEYYATKRGISSDYLCEVSLPVGQIATADQLLAVRKTIIENCICKILPSSQKPNPCSASNIVDISKVSPISHLVLIRGIPPRLTGTGWASDNEEPSFDYYLAVSLYRNATLFGAGSNNGTFLSAYDMTYSGNIQDSLDFQTSRPQQGYTRAINVSFDKVVAYGRVEAMDKERTIDLIDRTISAENAGFSGAIFLEEGEVWKDNYDFYIYSPYRELTSTDYYCENYLNTTCLNSCSSYEQEQNCKKGIWPSQECSRLGVNLLGNVPGKPGNSIIYPISAGLLAGLDPWPNGHAAFDGFYNMINWRKTSSPCTPLCKDMPSQGEIDLCRSNSKDYFKEINTDCVGVSNGFLGFQLRSWPVQFYGFYPAGWTETSGGNGEYEKTVGRVLNGTGFQNEKFSDTKYLHLGFDDVVQNPLCTYENGNLYSCPEMIAVNLRQPISLNPEIVLDGPKNFTIRFRHRNPSSGIIYANFYVSLSNGTSYYASSSPGYTRIYPSENWVTEQVNVSISASDANLTSILLDVASANIIGWLDLDGFEVIESSTGKELTKINVSSFVEPQIGYTQPGDYAANIIDRLGGIASWGSSSHHLTAGWAFDHTRDAMFAFFSGRSLGESLLTTGVSKGMSGIIYADPLYRPSGVKIYLGNGLISWGLGNVGYYFNKSNQDSLYINAFHGKENLDTVKWQVSFCNSFSVKTCDQSSLWEPGSVKTGAVFGQEYETPLLDFVRDKSLNQNFILRLKVWNEGQESNSLTNYGFFRYIK